MVRALALFLSFAFIAGEIFPFAGHFAAPRPVCAHGCAGVCCCSGASEVAACQPTGFGRQETSYSNCGTTQTRAFVKIVCDRIAPVTLPHHFIPNLTQPPFFFTVPSLKDLILSPLDPPPWRSC